MHSEGMFDNSTNRQHIQIIDCDESTGKGQYVVDYYKIIFGYIVKA